jgi:hypothetical protein
LPLFPFQDDAKRWRRQYDLDMGVAPFHGHEGDSDGSASPDIDSCKGGAPVGTADEDHIGSMADLMSQMAEADPPPRTRAGSGAAPGSPPVGSMNQH